MPTIVMMDPPEHSRWRRIVSRSFTPRHVAGLEADLRQLVRARLRQLREAGKADFVDGLARPVPSWVVAHFLGVPEEDRYLFDRWTEAVVQGGGGRPSEAGTALGELYGYFTELVDRRRHQRADDLVSTLLEADDAGAGLGLEGILGYAFVLIAGGNDTTTGLLAGAAELLTAYPDQRRRLLDEPTVVPGAVEELLRLTSPVQGLCRVAGRDVVVGERIIRSRDRVLLCYGAANRDTREFGPDAEALDVTRRIDRLLSFSTGAHFCLGAAAARLQGRVVLEELLRQCPAFVVDADAGVFADGAFTRRYESLPFSADGW
jgi:cytochrome P450